MTYFRLQFLLEFCISVRYPDISTYQWLKLNLTVAKIGICCNLIGLLRSTDASQSETANATACYGQLLWPKFVQWFWLMYNCSALLIVHWTQGNCILCKSGSKLTCSMAWTDVLDQLLCILNEKLSFTEIIVKEATKKADRKVFH